MVAFGAWAPARPWLCQLGGTTHPNHLSLSVFAEHREALPGSESCWSVRVVSDGPALGTHRPRKRMLSSSEALPGAWERAREPAPRAGCTKLRAPARERAEVAPLAPFGPGLTLQKPPSTSHRACPLQAGRGPDVRALTGAAVSPIPPARPDLLGDLMSRALCLLVSVVAGERLSAMGEGEAAQEGEDRFQVDVRGMLPDGTRYRADALMRSRCQDGQFELPTDYCRLSYYVKQSIGRMCLRPPCYAT